MAQGPTVLSPEQKLAEAREKLAKYPDEIYVNIYVEFGYVQRDRLKIPQHLKIPYMLHTHNIYIYILQVLKWDMHISAPGVSLPQDPGEKGGIDTPDRRHEGWQHGG